MSFQGLGLLNKSYKWQPLEYLAKYILLSSFTTIEAQSMKRRHIQSGKRWNLSPTLIIRLLFDKLGVIIMKIEAIVR